MDSQDMAVLDGCAAIHDRIDAAVSASLFDRAKLGAELMYLTQQLQTFYYPLTDDQAVEVKYVKLRMFTLLMNAPEDAPEVRVFAVSAPLNARCNEAVESVRPGE